MSERQKAEDFTQEKKREEEKWERENHLWAIGLLIVPTLSGPPEHSPLMAAVPWGLSRAASAMAPRIMTWDRLLMSSRFICSGPCEVDSEERLRQIRVGRSSESRTYFLIWWREKGWR